MVKTILLVAGVFLAAPVVALAGAAEERTGEATGDEQAAVPSGSYREAPMLTELVARGELPPVDDRLPAEPALLEPIESVGQYGGTLFVQATDNSPWGDLQEETERGSYLGRFRFDRLEVEGNLAQGFEQAEDDKSITIFLRPGARWSDGAPFTADDILFMYEDMHWHDEVETWMWLPQARRVVKIDDYTVRLETDEPYPVLTLKMAEPAGGDWHSYYPKHYLQKWHIRYNPDANALAKEEGFDSWDEAFRHHFWWNPRQDMNFPTMQPWVITQSNTTNKVHERNPYYWKVDSQGQQLPYVDRIVTDIVDWETYHLRIISGASDVAFVNTLFENYSLYKQNEQAGGYRVVLLPGNKGADVGFSINQNHPDPVKGSVYGDVRFRQAISLAIDRDDLNEALFFGLAVPRQFTILPNASFYKAEWGEAYAQFDPGRANELLDAVGLERRDRDGYRVGADGKTFEMIVEYGVGGEAADPSKSLELVKEYWEEVGLKVLLKQWEYGYFGQRREDPEHEIMFKDEPMKEVRHFMVERESWTAASTWAPLWHAWLLADANVKDGSRTLDDYGGALPGEEPPEYVKQLFEYGEARIRTDLGSPEYREYSQKIYDWHAEQLVHIGAVGMAPAVYIAKDHLGNVPQEFYTGIGGSIDLNILGEQLFFKQ